MNKVSYLAIAIALLVTPSIMFASSDSWSFGASNAGSSHQGSGMGAGKVSMQDMHVMRECAASTSSGMMDDECTKGNHIKDAILTKRDAGTSPMMMGSGMEHDGKGLMLAIGALSPADREILMKMVRDYLLSKGIDPVKYAEMREEIKDMRKDTHDEIKDMRKSGRDEIKDMRKSGRDSIKIKREEMVQKIKNIKAQTTSYDLKTNVKM